MFDGTIINPLIAFLSGLMTFFASCLLPLVPTYLAYLSGVGVKQNKSPNANHNSVLKHALMFVIGFILIFVMFGATLNRFGGLLHPYRYYLTKIGGLLFILFGLFLMGFLQNSWLQKEHKIKWPHFFERWPYLNSFLFGAFFSLGWSPCIGPVLAVILLWSSQQENFASGILLLFLYGVGIGVPFLLSAVGLNQLLPLFRKSQRLAIISQKIAGWFIFATGLLIFSGQFKAWSLWISNFLNLHTLTF